MKCLENWLFFDFTTTTARKAAKQGPGAMKRPTAPLKEYRQSNGEILFAVPALVNNQLGVKLDRKTKAFRISRMRTRMDAVRSFPTEAAKSPRQTG